MSIVEMTRLEIVALKDDMDGLLSLLGEAGCFQIADFRQRRPGDADGPEGKRSGSIDGRAAAWSAAFSVAQSTIEDIRRELGLSYPGSIPAGTRMPRAHDADILDSMREMTEALDEEERRNLDLSGEAREALEEALVFDGLSLPFRDLERLSFLAARIGRIDPEASERLRAALGDRALVCALGRRGDVVAVATKKGRFALDTELARAGFEPRKLSKDFAGVPPELPAALEAEIDRLDAERADIWMRKAELRSRVGGPWARIAASYAVASCVEEAKIGLESSKRAYRIEGWAPRERIGLLASAIDARFPHRTAMRSYAPEEVEAVRSGEEEVPVLLAKRPLVSSFERMVLSFGVPRYGGIDPTPFVCVFFTLLFSIMFGDLGQGFLIFAGAFAIRRGLVPSLARWREFAPIGMAAGAGSMIMGFLTGSVFAFDETLVPITRAISGAILGLPRDRFLSVMPGEGGGGTLALFGFSLGLGAAINSTGLAINIVDRLRRGDFARAFFSKTGLAGAALFWWSLGMAVRAIVGSPLGWVDAIGLGVPLLALMLEEPFGRAASRLGRRNEGAGKDGRAVAGPGPAESGDGAFAALIKGFVSVLESVSYYLSGTLSFLRVGAFALSHAVLSLIVFTLGDALGKGSPAGFAWQALVVVAGNAVILFLEGLVVAIQVVRLQYYEFLSKFLNENGRPFEPFAFHFRKEYV